ncbi:hypothetical protein [Mycolicibacterium grossiae]|uniref:Uncharacterized protein n=1 Tax=Mycolicibacterium grossiae TaxID=1552759 RepID=A0A1E8QAA3_9MYCO|nr:hypothetical protein [Mycolicibacterium grossiae]OFJ55181.1 hypothetical protein BEL07_03125 [Mycolicibacterium grossiae]QEM46096.1 hypothetical protein FZ046_16185 [Mycolicibacterium grossiae]
MAAKYGTLNAAMAARDELAEVQLRYKLLAEAFEEFPQLRSNLNPQLERAKAEIVRLSALKARGSGATSDKVVAFDAARFRKSNASPQNEDAGAS